MTLRRLFFVVFVTCSYSTLPSICSWLRACISNDDAFFPFRCVLVVENRMEYSLASACGETTDFMCWNTSNKRILMPCMCLFSCCLSHSMNGKYIYFILSLLMVIAAIHKMAISHSLDVRLHWWTPSQVLDSIRILRWFSIPFFFAHFFADISHTKRTCFYDFCLFIEFHWFCLHLFAQHDRLYRCKIYKHSWANFKLSKWKVVAWNNFAIGKRFRVQTNGYLLGIKNNVSCNPITRQSIRRMPETNVI